MNAAPSDSLLRAYAAAAPAAIDEILDQWAAGASRRPERQPVVSPAEMAGVLLDMRAGVSPAGGALRVVVSDEAQLEGLFRTDLWSGTRPELQRAGAGS